MLAIQGRIELTAMAQAQAATAPTEPTHRYLEVEGRRLHYLDWGGDPGKRTFVLLHGGAAHAHWWDGVAPMLTPYGRVLALDFRGHGRSQWADSEHYGPPSYLKDVRGLIDSLGTRAVLVGHSMGGAVAQRVAVAHPELLDALIMVDAPHRGPPLWRRLMWRWRRRSHGGVRPELRSAGEIIRKFRLHPPETNLTRLEIERLALRAADVFGLTFTGVDLVEGPDGYLTYEVSAFGGFGGLWHTQGIDAARLYAEHVVGVVTGRPPHDRTGIGSPGLST